MLESSQCSMSAELARRVNEQSIEKGNLDAFLNMELFLKQSSSFIAEGGVGVEESSLDVADISSMVRSPALQQTFACYLEEPGILVSSWTPVLLVITENRWLHVFAFPHDVEVKGNKADVAKMDALSLSSSSASSGLARFALQHRLLFEDDLAKTFSPASKTMNAMMKRLDDVIGLDDIEGDRNDIIKR